MRRFIIPSLQYGDRCVLCNFLLQSHIVQRCPQLDVKIIWLLWKLLKRVSWPSVADCPWLSLINYSGIFWHIWKNWSVHALCNCIPSNLPKHLHQSLPICHHLYPWQTKCYQKSNPRHLSQTILRAVLQCLNSKERCSHFLALGSKKLEILD